MEAKYILNAITMRRLRPVKRDDGLTQRKASLTIELLSIGNVSDITESDILTNVWHALDGWEWKKVKP